eukprot:9607465-Ditylum_brightwellii.AAC.1
MVQLESDSMYCWLRCNIPSLVLCYITKVKPLTPFSPAFCHVDDRNNEDDVNNRNGRNKGNNSGGNGDGNKNGNRDNGNNNNNSDNKENIEFSHICTICGGVLKELWGCEAHPCSNQACAFYFALEFNHCETCGDH